jgi:hypothetical protein
LQFTKGNKYFSYTAIQESQFLLLLEKRKMILGVKPDLKSDS